jgi:hypothetical protein
LADGLGLKTEQIIENSNGMIFWADTNQPIHALNYIETFDAKQAETIAYTQDKKVCGIKINHGKGSASILGTGFMYQSEAHKYAWQKLSLAENFKGRFTCDNPLIITRTRLHKNVGGYFFVLNYHNQSIATKTNFGGELFLPAFGGLVLPFDLPLTEWCVLRNTTSEIANIKTSDEKIVLEITGHSKTPGQMILDTTKIIKAVNLDNEPITFKQSGRGATINYSHCDKTANMEILW